MSYRIRQNFYLTDRLVRILHSKNTRSEVPQKWMFMNEEKFYKVSSRTQVTVCSEVALAGSKVK